MHRRQCTEVGGIGPNIITSTRAATRKEQDVKGPKSARRHDILQKLL